MRVKTELQLATGAHQAIVVENAQPPSIGHDPLRHAGRLGGSARGKPGKLCVDVAEGKPSFQKPAELSAHHELRKLEPLDRS